MMGISIYWICITMVLATFSWVVIHELQWMMKRRRLPPGPKGLPILGSLHLLGKNPHQDLFKLSQKHGPIMHMRFGLVPTIIVSSPEAAEKFLKTHDHSFATRPYAEAAWYLTYGQRDIIFAPYGSYLRNMRKLCIKELLSNPKISLSESMRKEEVGKMINTIKQSASSNRDTVVDLSASVAYMILCMSSLMVFGKNYMEEEIGNRSFKKVIADMSHFAAVPNLGDFFPFLGVLDLQGLTRKYKDLSTEIDNFLNKIIDDHAHAQISQRKEKNKDFVDTMMGILESGEAEFEFDQRHVKCVILNMFTTTSETVATTIDWTMTELIKHPDTMKKLQAEIQKNVGNERMIEESELEGLEYLDAVVKETMRLHPAAPLLLPHEAIEDCNVDGFHIERKSRLIVNFYAISHDPNVWPEPNSFNPERFIGCKIDVRGHDFRLIPFGSGRRICPGVNFGLMAVKLVVAQLVHCFNWKLPDNMLPSDIDMDETFGFVTTKTKHLLVVPNYRL